jgi:hypothetical protein
MKRYLIPTRIEYQLANLRQLTFEITDACNLKCKYCAYGEFYNDYDKREDKKLPVKPETTNWITGTCPPFSKKMFVTVNGKTVPILLWQKNCIQCVFNIENFEYIAPNKIINTQKVRSIGHAKPHAIIMIPD